MEKNEMRNQAIEILLCRLDQLEEREIPELDAVYYRNTNRGGGALIVASDGGMLFVDPFFVEYEDHVERFVAGERSEFE